MTERQMDILYYLHAQDDFVPVSDISVALQVSVKTIRNELLIIQEVIKKESLGTLEKKPRLGIKLVIIQRSKNIYIWVVRQQKDLYLRWKNG